MRHSTRQAVVVALVVLLLVSGCAYKRRTATPSLASDLSKLESELDLLPPFPQPAIHSGSLWTDSGLGAALVRDPRAFRVNDLLTIVVQESSSGTNSANTDLTRTSDSNFTAPLAFGLDELRDLLTTDSDSTFAGDGSTARSSQLAGTITARVMRVLPNGDMVIAGQKIVVVNREKQVLTLVGSVRPVDVRSNNRIPSSMIGELTVRMWGDGEVDATVRQGWFMRIMNRIWPF